MGRVRSLSSPFTTKVVTGTRRRAAGSLFERLLLDEEDTALSPISGIEAVVASIKKNLDRTLNIHAGGAASNSKLGMVNFCDSMLSGSDIANDGITVIRDCILNAEPRINSVEVRHIPDVDLPLSLKFSVICTVQVEDYSEVMRLDLIMRDGKFHQIL